MAGVRVIGGGLAGCEAAWQLASRGIPVTLSEMRPIRGTPVHKTDRLGELVCSNSFRADKLDNAVGVLKQEMRELGSLVMRIADGVRVPAGAALAVDREQFAAGITRAIEGQALVTLVREEVVAVPPPAGLASPTILATGPLTPAPLSHAVAALVGSDHLYFYDAISPIVLAETIDGGRVFRASRWGRSSGRDQGSGIGDQGSNEGDYLNCPLTEAEYARFHEALLRAERAPLHEFDEGRFFEGCLPIEVMADRGVDTLRFGPMKPVGLVDPRTGRPPHAVVQLRQDTLAGDHFSLVGFQTQLKWGEQARVFRLIPGLERAEFVRFGMIHRNTYINAPRVLADTWQVRARPDLLVAGQISGVEGYVESAASGLLAGLAAAALATGRVPSAPPRTTALGALAYYVSHADPRHYQPTNVTFGIMPPLEEDTRGQGSGAGDRIVTASRSHSTGPRRPRRKLDRKRALAERALADLARWRTGGGCP